ncbi:PREDICTED: uncharacterized protein LOC101305844 [Fragaria vesca subsp. vesca]
MKHRTSNEHFDDYSSFIRRLLPLENKLPSSHYKAKKILNDLGLGYVKIEACKNNCVMFYGDYKDAFKCPKCNASRWEDTLSPKGKRVPMKVLRYFPLTRRLERLYMCGKTAEDMRWHDIRNVRLRLLTDRFNPFENMNLSYRPKSPEKCLDVYLRPLIDELNGLWENGALIFDKHTGTSFIMRASLMWTISDFPGYGMLSSHTNKGYKACPLYLTDINSSCHADRVCYMGARRWLPDDHEWRLDTVNFDGQQEFGLKPREWSGDEILDLLNSFDFENLSSDREVLARNPKRLLYLDNWTYKSIFFELPYWSKLRIRHNLDVMHIEKNVKPALRPKVFSWIQDVKYPQGYAANIARCVKVGEEKIIGMKMHDCHVLLQRLLPVVIGPYMHREVVETLVALSRF